MCIYIYILTLGKNNIDQTELTFKCDGFTMDHWKSPPFACDEDLPITCDENQHHQHHGRSVGGVWGGAVLTRKTCFTHSYILGGGGGGWGPARHSSTNKQTKKTIHSPASWGYTLLHSEGRGVVGAPDAHSVLGAILRWLFGFFVSQLGS